MHLIYVSSLQDTETKICLWERKFPTELICLSFYLVRTTSYLQRWGSSFRYPPVSYSLGSWGSWISELGDLGSLNLEILDHWATIQSSIWHTPVLTLSAIWLGNFISSKSIVTHARFWQNWHSFTANLPGIVRFLKSWPHFTTKPVTFNCQPNQ